MEDQRSDPQSAPQSVSQPVPTVRVGGSSSSGIRSGVGSRGKHMIVKRNVSDSQKSRCQKRQGEDVEDLAAKAEEQHLDADVEVPAHKTWRVEDVVGDAAEAAPEQMNMLLAAREQSMNCLVQSKTEVFEKFEESLRPMCMVEDLNDDEVMELCILSNVLNACETTAVLNLSKFASIGTSFGLREGFAEDLTTARANGTMWDLSLEDDKAELRRVQNQEITSCGKPIKRRVFFFVEHECSTRNQQIENRKLSHRSELVYIATNCRWKCKNTSFMNIPRILVRGRCLKFNLSSMTRECTASMVQCVAGV